MSAIRRIHPCLRSECLPFEDEHHRLQVPHRLRRPHGIGHPLRSECRGSTRYSSRLRCRSPDPRMRQCPPWWPNGCSCCSCCSAESKLSRMRAAHRGVRCWRVRRNVPHQPFGRHGRRRHRRFEHTRHARLLKRPQSDRRGQRGARLSRVYSESNLDTAMSTRIGRQTQRRRRVHRLTCSEPGLPKCRPTGDRMSAPF